MQVGWEITYRDVEKTDSIEALVREKVAKLEEVCAYINSCHVAIEKAHDRPRSGSPYRMRLDITVPPGHEIVADRNPGEGNQYDKLETVIRSAFDAARRQLVELVERQQERVKTHEEQQTMALVTKLFPEQDYGFIRSLDGRDIYFHRNSVVNDDYDLLEVGTGVRYVEQEGEMGPQASTVQIVDKPGVRVDSAAEQPPVEAPLGWQ